MRRDADKAADYAKTPNVSIILTDDLINDPEIDAIYIATPLIRINTMDQ
jgi:predicted dehydrogenase